VTGYGRKLVVANEMLRIKMSCSGPFCWGNNTLHLNLSQNQGTPSQNHTYNSEKEIENDFGRKELPETERMELLGETVPPIPKDGPPDRKKEINNIKLEITKIEEMIRLHSEQRKEKGKGTEVGTVPPYFGLKRSTKRKGKSSAGNRTIGRK
jgi:hypothetical protein